ncbi:MAG: hypothetical protein AAF975_08245, partial [Spirochaetota bacterium]
LKFNTDEGRIANPDLPQEDRVTVEIKRPSRQQKAKYLRANFNQAENSMSFQLDYDTAVSRHVKTIRGLEDLGITDGASLVKRQLIAEETETLLEELFSEICGLNHAAEEEELAGESRPSA